MRIIEQPNRWSCMPAAFATASGIPLHMILNRIGHDGSEIIFPDLDEPLCRRGFHGQELIKALFEFGFVIAQFELEPYAFIDDTHAYRVEWKDTHSYIANLLTDSIGVIGATVNGTEKRHAVAWDGKRCYDPTGFIYELARFTPSIYYRFC